MSAAALRIQPSLDMIETLTRCAHDLALAASGIAQRAGDDTALFLAASAEFRHSFFAVRMGIRLTMAERAAARAAGAAAPLRLERERSDAADPPERERDDSFERLETERDREGDYEPVSLPRFLRSLGVVAAKAEQRRDALPPHVRDTTLPTLRRLLDGAAAQSDGPGAGGGAGPALAVLARTAAASHGRSHLLNSTGPIGVPPLRPPAALRRGSG